MSDNALHKAIDYDHSHGISKRFLGLLNSALGTVQGVDHKFGVTQRAVAVDEKYSIQEKAKSTATGLMRYFENALDSPTGKRVRTFYDDRKKDVLEIHNEARRLANERKASNLASTSTAATSGTSVQPPASAAEPGSTAPATEKSG